MKDTPGVTDFERPGAEFWDPIRTCAMFTPLECRGLWERIEGLREYWTPRSSDHFYSLGSAAYLDATAADDAGRDRYSVAFGRSNPMLSEHFGEVHDRLISALRGLLGAPVRWQPQSALPGFHIWVDPPSNSEYPEPDLGHCDTFWGNLPWRSKVLAREDSVLSFTMPVAEPAEGSWLRIWKLHATEFRPDPPIEEQLATVESRTHRYEIGRLDIHSGLWFHCRHRPVGAHSGGYRVMLQGHAYRSYGIWWVYW